MRGGRRVRGNDDRVGWERMAERKSVVLVMTDVVQAIPNVAKTRLVNRLRMMGVEERLERWTGSFIEDRQIKLRMVGGEWHPVETGVRRGSPVSSVIFNSSIAPLLRQIHKSADRTSIQVVTPTFVEDISKTLIGPGRHAIFHSTRWFLRSGRYTGSPEPT